MAELTLEQIESVKKAFDMYDSNGEGAVSTKNLGAVMNTLGQNPTEDELEDMIRMIEDDDNIGHFEFPDFLALMGRRLI